MLDRFESYMRSMDMAENTIMSYGKDVRQFLGFIDSRGTQVHEVDHEILLQFLEYLTQRNLKGSTKRRKMEAMKTFYTAMCKLGELEKNPLSDFQDMPKMNAASMKVLTETEYRTLRDVVRGSRRKSSVRDYAILELALQTGLRISEICSMAVDDVEFSTRTTVGHVRVRKGKGGKERMVTLNDAAERAMKEYLAGRPHDTQHQELFLNNRLRPCTPNVVSEIFKKYMGKAGIAGASFHALRHTFATHSMRNGTEIIVVQKALGHKSLTTTQKYLHFIQEAMDKQLTRNSL